MHNASLTSSRWAVRPDEFDHQSNQGSGLTTRTTVQTRRAGCHESGSSSSTETRRRKPLQPQGPVPAFYPIQRRFRSVPRGTERVHAGRPALEVGRRGQTRPSGRAVTNEVVRIHPWGPERNADTPQLVQPRPAWGACPAVTRAPGGSMSLGDRAKVRRRKAQPCRGPKGLAGQTCWRRSRNAKSWVLMGNGELLVSAL